MDKCKNCIFAEWDYEDYYYGSPFRQWIFVGCKKELDEGDENCAEYKEFDNENKYWY